MKTIVMVMLLLGISTGAWGGGIGNSVEVLVRSDDGRVMPAYPMHPVGHNCKAYLEAVKGERYGIVVRNLLNRRIGVVIAVDGRNIISGKKSRLRSSERMYVLEPYATGEFNGWRTGLDRVNRFYFTDAADSYAAAFRDESAMGVIAVAVYPEVRRCESPMDMTREMGAAKGAPSARAQSESAGTGFGREEYSPARTVDFVPESSAAEKIYLKYEWRSTLCRQGIADCAGGWQRPNRMWDEEGFAPPPPMWR